MDYEHLILDQRGEVLWVTMNRPQSLNALNRRLVEEMRDLFTGLYWKHETRIVVLRGAGANFCAGLDLKERDNSGGSGPGNGLIRQRHQRDPVPRLCYRRHQLERAHRLENQRGQDRMRGTRRKRRK